MIIKILFMMSDGMLIHKESSRRFLFVATLFYQINDNWEYLFYSSPCLLKFSIKHFGLYVLLGKCSLFNTIYLASMVSKSAISKIDENFSTLCRIVL